MFGLFRKKPRITTQQKNEALAIISKFKTVLLKLCETDKPDTFYSSVEKFHFDLKLLERYAEMGLDTKPPVKKIVANTAEMLEEAEMEFLDRAIQRVGREAAKLTTEKGKQNKYKKFFSEMEFYSSQMSEKAKAKLFDMKNSFQPE